MSLPDAAAVRTQIAAFESDLSRAASARDAQGVRDRYLGRKNSVVASWMQMIGGAPVEQKRELGRLANELKQEIEGRWTAYQTAASEGARPAGSLDVTLPCR